MSSYSVHSCPHCGGPMPPPSATRSERCKFCSRLLSPGSGGWRAAPVDAPEEPLLDPHLPRLWVGGHRYCVMGRLAGRVYRARRDARITEHVLLKFGERERLEQEQSALTELEQSQVQGAAHFTRLLPQRVNHGLARIGMNGRDGEALCTVLRWRSGFVHTFEDVLRVHSRGVPAEHGVWMWKRILELLGWVHRAGFVHGAIEPGHLVLHARDHGVVLAGWSHAARGSASVDLAASANVIRRVIGSEPPAPLARVLDSAAGESDAWALKDRLDAAAREVFGPPRFVRFEM